MRFRWGPALPALAALLCAPGAASAADKTVKPFVLVIVNTWVSMDGTDGDSLTRMEEAKLALADVFAGTGEITFALQSYMRVSRCDDFPCDCDDAGASGTDETCATGDVLVEFGDDNQDELYSWVDFTCVNGTTGNPEIDINTNSGTPLAANLRGALDYLDDVIAADPENLCRPYKVILLTDGLPQFCLGANSCDDAEDAAAELCNFSVPGRTETGCEVVQTYVIGLGNDVAGESCMDDIAQAGGTGSALFANDRESLALAFQVIIEESVLVEVCDGVDNDCDGAIDEGFDVGEPCSAGIGACKNDGTIQCDSLTSSSCDAVPGTPADDELCNGEDDDCDIAIDEDIDCTLECDGTEICDGVDNDCDGSTDEGFPEVGTPCGETDVGRCEFGVTICAGGDAVCVGEIGPTDELCNGLDDDCDGEADEFAECPGETSCIEGGCRVPCEGVEFACPAGFLCVPVDDGSFCVPDPCVNCQPHETCIQDACVDLCEGVTCADPDESCFMGDCVDCHRLGCEAGDVCYDGACIPDPCDISCPAGHSCVFGECVPDCDDAACPPGRLCDADGACVPDPCGGVTCEGEGKVCRGGECVTDPCLDVACPLGDACADGECVANPCVAVVCTIGRRCVLLPDGSPRCEPLDPGLPAFDVYAAGGGGWCAARPERLPSPVGLALVLAAIVLAAARRRGGRR